MALQFWENTQLHEDFEILIVYVVASTSELSANNFFFYKLWKMKMIKLMK